MSHVACRLWHVACATRDARLGDADAETNRRVSFCALAEAECDATRALDDDDATALERYLEAIRARIVALDADAAARRAAARPAGAVRAAPPRARLASAAGALPPRRPAEAPSRAAARASSLRARRQKEVTKNR